MANVLKISNKNLRKALGYLGACADSKDWVGGKNGEEVWKTISRASWVLWLISHLQVGVDWGTVLESRLKQLKKKAKTQGEKRIISLLEDRKKIPTGTFRKINSVQRMDFRRIARKLNCCGLCRSHLRDSEKASIFDYINADDRDTVKCILKGVDAKEVRKGLLKAAKGKL